MSNEISTNFAISSGTPWVERYRPKSLDDVSHQAEIVATLKNSVATGRLPHLLFYGPPGSGKTSVALALCRQLWHPSQWRRRVLELNASDERGISVVRDKIKHFASLAVANSHSSHGGMNKFVQAKRKKDNDDDDDENKMDHDGEAKKYPNPPFKVIILDEADTVTADAQAALRRIIEAHSRITRFILICNYVTRIIEPLASRCAKFRFQALPPASMKERLSLIAQAEHCHFTEDQLDLVLELADGDMRRAVTTLQSAHALAAGGGTHVLNASDVAEIAGLPPNHVVDSLWKAMSQSTSYDAMQRAVDEVCADGYSAQLLLSALMSQKVLTAPELSEVGRADISIRIAEAEKNMIEGADEYLQLLNVCSLAQACLAESKTSLSQQ